MRKNQFETTVLVHIDAAYNLAHWLTGSGHDAEDVVQEAFIKAFRFFDSYHGGNARAWVLTIVRNTCYTWLRKNRDRNTVIFDEQQLDGDATLEQVNSMTSKNPETMLLNLENTALINKALQQLSLDRREVIILRDLEGLTYKEIAEIVNLPLGTIMSRLSRGRSQLQKILARHA